MHDCVSILDSIAKEYCRFPQLTLTGRSSDAGVLYG